MQQGTGSGDAKKVLLNVSTSVVERLMKERLTIDHLLILECLYNEDYDMLDRYDKSFTLERALNNYQNLERKELIVPSDDAVYYRISLMGREFYEEVIALSMGNTPVPSVIKSTRDKCFDEFWDAYPSTGNWTSDDGRKFMSSRSLRTGTKDNNRKLYNKILNEGRYTHREVIACLKYEVDAKKSQSLTTGVNHLQYMQGSLTWLNQRTFENFINEVRAGNSIEKTSSYDVG